MIGVCAPLVALAADSHVLPPATLPVLVRDCPFCKASCDGKFCENCGAHLDQAIQAAAKATSSSAAKGTLAKKAKLVLIPFCRKGDRTGVEKQLSAGASVEEVDVEGNTPLHVAVEAPRNEIVIVQNLLEHGANPNQTNYIGATPLHYLCLRKSNYRSLANVLLENGAHIDYQTVAGKTPLHFACEHQLPGLVELLLALGASAHSQDVERNSALHLVLKEQGRDTVKCKIISALLAAGKAGGLSDPSSWGAWDRSQAGFGCHNVEGHSPLHLAITTGSTRCAQLLLERHANPRAKMKNGKTALHLACSHNFAELSVLVLAMWPSAVDMLDQDGNSALHECAEGGHLECALVLLKKDCNPELRNHSGKSPQDLAAIRGTDLNNNHNPELLQALRDCQKGKSCQQQ